MFTVAYFGIRPFQITDGSGEYSFGDYLRHRKWTSGFAVLISAVYLAYTLAVGSYSAGKAAAVFLLAMYKIIDGFADVYESEFQRQGHLYLTGKSNTFRTILSVCAFLAGLVLSNNQVSAEGSLLIACTAAAAAQIAGVILFNLSVICLLYTSYNYAYMPVVFEDYKWSRDEIYDRLAEKNIFARKYFYPCINAYDCYKDRFNPHDTPVAELSLIHI